MVEPDEELVDLIVQRLHECDVAGQWAMPRIGARAATIDSALPPDEAHALYTNVSSAPPPMRRRTTFREHKSTCHDRAKLEPLLGKAIAAFEHPRTIAAIAAATGISGLQADPSLYAAGLSAMGRDDYLNPHLDNSHDRQQRRWRRINLLYYFTPAWREEWGGALELWDEDLKRRECVSPLFNRLVLMETSASSWHSVSPVIHDEHRLCLSSYLFSAVAPEGETHFRATSFTGRPNQHWLKTIGPIDNALRQWVRKRTGRRAAR